MELKTINALRRGKLTDESQRAYQYQGIGRVTPGVDGEADKVDTAGVITTIEEALSLAGGNLQAILDGFAASFNRSQAAAVIASAPTVDELSPFVLSLGISGDDEKSFRRAITVARNVLADNGIDKPLADIVAVVSKKLAAKNAAK